MLLTRLKRATLFARDYFENHGKVEFAEYKYTVISDIPNRVMKVKKLSSTRFEIQLEHHPESRWITDQHGNLLR